MKVWYNDKYHKFVKSDLSGPWKLNSIVKANIPKRYYVNIN